MSTVIVSTSGSFTMLVDRSPATNFMCDQIYQKGSYTCTVSGITFHGHSTDTTIDQQFMLVPLPKLQQSAFTEASFMGLFGVHGCSGGI